MPRSDGEERMHRLQQLSSVISDIDAQPSSRSRYDALRNRYDLAAAQFDDLIAAVPSVGQRDKAVWNTAPSDVLDSYAAGEGF
jgi:hypothetical protein